MQLFCLYWLLLFCCCCGAATDGLPMIRNATKAISSCWRREIMRTEAPGGELTVPCCPSASFRLWVLTWISFKPWRARLFSVHATAALGLAIPAFAHVPPHSFPTGWNLHCTKKGAGSKRFLWSSYKNCIMQNSLSTCQVLQIPQSCTSSYLHLSNGIFLKA